MANLVIVFFVLLLAVIAVMVYFGFSLPTGARKKIVGEIRIPLGHRYWLRTPVDHARITRMGSDWIIIESDPLGKNVVHKGFVVGTNLVSFDVNSLVSREKTFWSALCLDHKLRYNFANPVLGSFFRRVEDGLKESAIREDELNKVNLFEQRMKDSQSVIDNFILQLHDLTRAVGVGRGFDKNRRSEEE